MTAQNIYYVPQEWQMEMYLNPSKYVQEMMSDEDWYHTVMFELFEPEDFWETHHHYPFGSEEHKNYMLENYGVVSFTQHPEYGPIIFEKIRKTMADPEWKKWFSENRSQMYQERYDSDYFSSIQKKEYDNSDKRDYNWTLEKEEVRDMRSKSSAELWKKLRSDEEKLSKRNDKIAKQQSITSTSDEYIERNTYECDLCGSKILKLGNLRQHRNGKKCKRKQRELQTSH